MSRYSDKVSGAGGRGFSAEIRIEGLEQTLGVLRAIEPEVLKRLQAQIKESAEKVTKGAAMEFAMTGHGMGTYKMRNTTRGKKTGLRIFAKGKDEAIFEFAGTRGGPYTPQGAGLVDWLSRRFGKPGRFLWNEWDRQKAEFERDLRSAMDEAEAHIQSHLNAIGETY